MKISSVFIFLCTVQAIWACGVGVSPPALRPPPSERDWEHWELPPYNEDWEGFVNLLGTREIIVKTTTAASIYSNEDGDIESQPGFPKEWENIGIGYTGMNPPSKAKIEGFIGQSAFCFDRHQRGHGDLWFLRWYFDAHSGVCKKFVYKGLGGNANRFITEYNCNVSCVWPAQLPCLPENLFDYHMYIGYRRLLFVRLN